MKIKKKINNIVSKSEVLSYFKKLYFRRKWRKLNSHNFTTAKNAFNIKLVKIGVGTYGELNIRHFGNEAEEYVEIGNYCSIAPEVIFITGGEHKLNYISSYPFKTKIVNNDIEAFSKGPILIEDDVWIGYGSKILSGVKIGQGAVVGAGSVVTKDVPPYAIVGGTPAHIIKYRFNDSLIQELLKIDYSKMSPDFIKLHIDDLYVNLQDKEQCKWMPKK